uniref:Nucleolus and neural progenitor protein-like N-terminal domain-containing protein n=2 Tax=Drosophila melanogaster TaxID=7227 RepID=Q9VT39_DROME|nr:uncharacterized protein Dmel_CG14174 [Drosophila melanogaster]AAF50216.1 uncharacterized protein Dmel_CG14174 [Drosophila melanogaster]AOQ11807.1 CG14174-RA [synthetic construct]|eukprot:NP_648351.1 uncharacterized protein Dmel_CG14174 [Drosophila melanogaster]
MENEFFWNDFKLKQPPLVTLLVKDTGFAKNVFVVINRFLQQLSEPDAKDFEETAAMIGRLMARRKNSFRNMPGFRSVCKLNAALCRLLRLDLARDLKNFRGVLPDVCDEDLGGAMPTRSSFEFILVRLLGFYHLHERIRECCLSAAAYFTQLLRNNFFMDFTTLLIAAIAKISKLSSLQAGKSAILYNKLRPQIANFPQVEKHKFLAENQELPARLEPPTRTNNQTQKDETPDIVLIPKKVVTKVEKAKLLAKSDVGTIIARKETPVQDTKKPTFNENVLATVADAQKFIERESQARKLNPPPESCFTRKIAKHEWLAAQTMFNRKLSKEPEKALNIFRKFIVSKIK